MHSPFDGNHVDPLFRGMDVQARWGHLQCRVACTNVLLEILSGRWQRLVLTGHTSEQISEWLCRGGENIVQPKHLATAATQSGALFLVLKAECIVVCAPMWHGTQWVYHQPLHLIRSVQGLLPRSPGASPLPSCLPLISKLGCPSNMPSRSIPFLDCLLLFSRLGYPGSTPGKGILFPSCLLLFNELSCPGSTPGRGILFLGCLLLFSELSYPGSTPSKGILFPSCLLLFSGLSCPGNALGGSIHLPGCINARGGGPKTRNCFFTSESSQESTNSTQYRYLCVDNVVNTLCFLYVFVIKICFIDFDKPRWQTWLICSFLRLLIAQSLFVLGIHYGDLKRYNFSLISFLFKFWQTLIHFVDPKRDNIFLMPFMFVIKICFIDLDKPR